MKLVNGSIVLETKNCTACAYNAGPPGTQAKEKWTMCLKCKGTGKRGRGKCRSCAPAYYGAPANPGYIRFWDQGDREPCRKCGGDYQDREQESYTDNLPPEVFTDLPIVVEGSGMRRMSNVEQLFGMGVYTIIDYGRHKTQTDGDLIAYMRDQLVTGRTSVQACKCVKSKDDLTFCSGLAIMRADQGFSVIPYYD